MPPSHIKEKTEHLYKVKGVKSFIVYWNIFLWVTVTKITERYVMNKCFYKIGSWGLFLYLAVVVDLSQNRIYYYLFSIIQNTIFIDKKNRLA